MEVFSHNNPFRGPVRAVVLDWAGTAVDYGCIGPATVLVEIFRQNWVEVTIEEARAPMGLAEKDHLRAMCRTKSIEKKWEDVYGSPPTEMDIDKMVQSVESLMAYTIGQHSDPVPGLIDTVEVLRERGIRIGSSSEYSFSVMQALVSAAETKGYLPDSVVCSSDVPAGRPFPWMCYQNAINLQIYPMHAMVKIGDTLMDIQEGLNAGMWTIGLTGTGNELGLTEAEVAALGPEEVRSRLKGIEERFRSAGAHFVAEGIWACPAIIEKIDSLLSGGERP